MSLAMCFEWRYLGLQRQICCEFDTMERTTEEQTMLLHAELRSHETAEHEQTAVALSAWQSTRARLLKQTLIVQSDRTV